MKPTPEENEYLPQDQPTVIQEPIQAPVREVAQPTPVPDPGVLTPLFPIEEKTPLPLSRVGEYEILCTIGRGGMGIVFKARHVRLNRMVALKMLTAGVLARPEDLQRFENEAAASAQLQHPNIVALYEAGTNEGQPFFSMEFIQGSSLASRAALGVIPGRLAASYLERVARAVHYAHTRSIIHRDLKPANILLDENDEPKISDFGLAKLLRGDSGQTRTGTVMGTPSYMAPEQANARKDIGPACDVYSLGAILYELIAGRPPFQEETALATLRRVANDEPIAPSILNPGVDRDLETICLKCLEKDPARRYLSAQMLADDLRRYLNDEPITARPVSFVGRTWKWVQRKPATAALMFVILAGLVSFGVIQWRVAEQERELRAEAEKQSIEAKKQKKLADEQIEITKKAHQEVLQREEILRHFLYDAEVQQIHHAWEDADLARAQILLNGWQPAGQKKDLRQWEWYYLDSLCRGSKAWKAHSGRATSVAYHPRGKQLATAGGNVGKPGEVRIWDLHTGKMLASLPQNHSNMISALEYSPEGDLLATASDDHSIRLWDPATKKELAILKGHTAHVTAIAFSPDGKQLASAGGDNTVIIWNLTAPPSVENTKEKVAGKYERLHTLTGHGAEITSLGFSPDGNMLASASFDETVRLWNPTNGKLQQILRGHQGEILSLAFHPTGNMLISAGGPAKRGGQLKRWDLTTGKEIQSHEGLGKRVLRVAVSKAGHIVAACNDGILFLWNERFSTEPVRFRADNQLVYNLAFSPNGQQFATAGSNGQVRVWNSSGSQETLLLSSHQRTEALGFSPKGQFIFTAGRSPEKDGEVSLFEARTGKLIQAFSGHAGNVFTAAFHPGEKWLASGGEDQTILLHDLTSKQPPISLRGHRGRVMGLAFHPDGKMLASVASEDDNVLLWDLETGHKKGSLTGDPVGILCIAFSPDGRFLAAGGYKSVTIWDLKMGTSFSVKGHKGTVHTVAFSPDSTQLAFAGADPTIHIWDLLTGKEFLKLEGSTRSITSLAYHPRWQRLATVGPDHVVRLWDLITRQEILELHGPAGPLRSVAFSPDGWQLVTGGDYPLIHVWDARPAP